jgi:hypothetical protein
MRCAGTTAPSLAAKPSSITAISSLPSRASVSIFARALLKALHLLKHVVAVAESMLYVDGIEVVQIQQNEPDELMLTLRPRHGSRQAIVKLTAIGQFRPRIVLREVLGITRVARG